VSAPSQSHKTKHGSASMAGDAHRIHRLTTAFHGPNLLPGFPHTLSVMTKI
jgi:hypothetical protein